MVVLCDLLICHMLFKLLLFIFKAPPASVRSETPLASKYGQLTLQTVNPISGNKDEEAGPANYPQ